MTNYLLDTDICTYWLKGYQAVKDHLLNTGIVHIAISVITAAELYFGVYNSVRVEENHFQLERFLDYYNSAIRKSNFKYIWGA